jgi:integrase
MIGSSRFQNGSLMLVKNKTAVDSWFLRYYESVNGKRIYRKRRIGDAKELPHRRDAEMAALALREKINAGTRSPETVRELITHYISIELADTSGKRSSTREVYAGFLKVQIGPQWGNKRLDQVKTVAVEQWLRSLPYAPATKSKIRNIMSALFAHARRYGMLLTNPIQGVRCSSMRLREPDILSPEEFNRLLAELPLREKAMVLMAGTTGLRRSELIALIWRDIDFDSLQIEVNRSCVRGKVGETKTRASAKPVPMHRILAAILKEWRQVTLYPNVEDYLFPSIRNNGASPIWPDMVLQHTIRPALHRLGITKRVGFHTFRHSLGYYLRSLGVDIKVAQELLRHANVKITLDLYTQAVSSQKREANERLVEMLLRHRNHELAPFKPSSSQKVTT